MTAGTLVVDQINSSSGVLGANNAMLGIAKAWVNFDGTLSGTIAPRSAFNVSSVTKNGTGDYTINLTTAMADANYIVVGMGRSTTNAQVMALNQTQDPTTTSVRVSTQMPGTAVGDDNRAMLAVLGN